MQTSDYKVIQHKQKIKYDKILLWKYHELSRQLAMSTDEWLEKKLNIKKEISNKGSSVAEAEITLNYFFKYTSAKDAAENKGAFVTVMDGMVFSEQEYLLYETLLYITYMFVEHEYNMFYISNDSGVDISDAEIHKKHISNVKIAYDYLKELRNLLLMRESVTGSTDIVFDLRDEHGKKQKDYQVRITDGSNCRTLVDKQIESIMEILRSFGNEYVSESMFAGIRNEDLTSQHVIPLFEKVRPLIEYDKKQSSGRRNFKGLISRVVHDFVTTEKLTYRREENKEEVITFTESDEKLLTYFILMCLGLMEWSLIESHYGNRDSCIKYMLSLPQFNSN